MTNILCACLISNSLLLLALLIIANCCVIPFDRRPGRSARMKRGMLVWNAHDSCELRPQQGYYHRVEKRKPRSGSCSQQNSRDGLVPDPGLSTMNPEYTECTIFERSSGANFVGVVVFPYTIHCPFCGLSLVVMNSWGVAWAPKDTNSCDHQNVRCATKTKEMRPTAQGMLFRQRLAHEFARSQFTYTCLSATTNQ
jgi:hypothetical protein